MRTHWFAWSIQGSDLNFRYGLCFRERDVFFFRGQLLFFSWTRVWLGSFFCLSNETVELNGRLDCVSGDFLRHISTEFDLVLFDALFEGPLISTPNQMFLSPGTIQERGN